MFGPSGDSCNGEGTAGPAQQSYMRLVYYSDAAGLRPMQRPTGAYFTIWFCIDHHLMPHTPTMMRVPPSVAGDEGASLCAEEVASLHMKSKKPSSSLGSTKSNKDQLSNFHHMSRSIINQLSFLPLFTLLPRWLPSASHTNRTQPVPGRGTGA